MKYKKVEVTIRDSEEMSKEEVIVIMQGISVGINEAIEIHRVDNLRRGV